MKLSLPQKQNVHEKNALLFFGFPLLLNIALYCNVIFSSGQVDWSFSPRVLVQFALSTGLLTILYALVTTLFPQALDHCFGGGGSVLRGFPGGLL